MLRSVLTRVSTTCLQASRAALFKPNAAAATSMRYSSHGTVETDADFDARYIAYFNNTDNDGWDIRNAMNTLQGYDLVPEPTIIIAGLKACRRLNDYAMAVRFLEAVKDKCGKRADQIWPYILSEINPTLKELSIETPEELGYDKPELAVVNVNDMHG